jgi:Mg2+-importing ATPase
MMRAHAEHGMRMLAVAVKQCPGRAGRYDEDDEHGLTLVGFIGFVDPVREGAAEAVRTLREHGVAVKILTGDNEHVAAHVCARIGVPSRRIALGRQIDKASNAELRALVERTSVFAKLTPAHKARIVRRCARAGTRSALSGTG